MFIICVKENKPTKNCMDRNWRKQTKKKRGEVES